jgi:hypothetical protein
MVAVGSTGKFDPWSGYRSPLPWFGPVLALAGRRRDVSA